MKILVLVLAARARPYPMLIRTIERTWASVEVDGVSTLSYFGGDRLEQRGRRLYLPVTDELPAGRKTIACFEHVLAADDFDLVFRTNASSYVDLPNLRAFADAHARLERFYCGRRGMYGDLPFASGSGYFLSRDLVRLVVGRQHELHQWLPDDISLAMLLHDAGVELVDAPRVDYTSARYVRRVDTSQFLFRCKTESPWRIGDVRLMLTLQQAFVRARGGRYRSPLLRVTTALADLYSITMSLRGRRARGIRSMLRTVERALRQRLGLRAIASPVIPRPRLRSTRRRSSLTDVVVSSDLNPRYLDAWDLARRVWRDVGGVRPHLLLVAPAGEVPPALADDPDVHVFEPVAGLHTAFQAQCIRLLYPALLETDGAVITSDIDMIPLNRRYFHDPVTRMDERHFLAYRDALLASAEIPICYNAALPGVWSELFDVRSIDDVARKLSEWGAGVPYDGARGGHGWHSDQLILHRTLVTRGRARRDVWILRDAFSGFKRLPPGAVGQSGRLVDAERDRIRRGAYADFHMLLPYEQHRAVNDEVAEAATETRFS